MVFEVSPKNRNSLTSGYENVLKNQQKSEKGENAREGENIAAARNTSTGPVLRLATALPPPSVTFEKL